MRTKDINAPEANWVTRVTIGRDPKRTLVRIVIWVGLILLIYRFALLPIRVQGISMLPTYKENGINFVNRLAYLFHPPQRGDVVAIRLAGEHIMFCKRIVGLPGESVAFHQGRLLINGQALEEPYLKKECNWEEPAEQVDVDEYFVVGDNRSMDYSLHEKGRALRSRIVGKLLL
jgi:signal peptidase I